MKISSKALGLRLEYGRVLGKVPPQSTVAEEAGVDRNALARLEENKTRRFDGESIARLCAFYSRVLNRPVDVGDILEYDPDGILMGSGGNASHNTPPLPRAPVGANY